MRAILAAVVVTLGSGGAATAGPPDPANLRYYAYFLADVTRMRADVDSGDFYLFGTVCPVVEGWNPVPAGYWDNKFEWVDASVAFSLYYDTNMEIAAWVPLDSPPAEYRYAVRNCKYVIEAKYLEWLTAYQAMNYAVVGGGQ